MYSTTLHSVMFLVYNRQLSSLTFLKHRWLGNVSKTQIKVYGSWLGRHVNMEVEELKIENCTRSCQCEISSQCKKPELIKQDRRPQTRQKYYTKKGSWLKLLHYK